MRGSIRLGTFTTTAFTTLAFTLAMIGTPSVAEPASGSPTYVDPIWEGAYIGVETGAGLGKSDVSDPYGPSIFGDTVRTPEFLIGLDAGYNWQAPGSSWVYGIEGSLSYQDGKGSNTCFAATGQLTSSNCLASPDWTGSLTGRVGYAPGFGRTLLFAKGGLAFQHSDVEAITNNRFDRLPISRTGSNTTSWGWTLGAGAERLIAPAWSVKLEYDYLDFGSHDFASPPTFSTTPGDVTTAVPSRTASIDQTNHLVKIGLNYRFGVDPQSGWSQAPAASPGMLFPNWSLETGVRYFYSVGRFEKNLGTSIRESNISRLTYQDLSANAGELFARADSPWGIFVKGFVGGGQISGGHLNDEDWGLDIGGNRTGYSNTIADVGNTGINYLTIDAGYDFMKGPTYKVGVFAGYNRIHEKYDAINCWQIASPTSGICAPTLYGLGITETDNWNSLRLGLETVVFLAPDLKLTADAAYLPYVRFDGVDHHVWRSLYFDQSGDGQGAQIEAILSYYLTPEFSLGVGGRYWAMWMDDGTDVTGGVLQHRKDDFRYERAGVFLQAAYQFDSAAGN